MSEMFTPSPGKLVKFVDDQGKVVSERRLNRKERRRLKIGNKRGR